MPSERRLHPLSIVFNVLKQLGAFAIPLILVIVGAGSDNDRWAIYGWIWLVPFAIITVGQYLSLRYRYEDNELVIRRGFIFRNQRHIPYERIQNIDAVQNVLHRVTGLVEVKLQTGGGSEPEATLSVLTLADLAEMRRRVFATRHAAVAAAPSAAALSGAPDGVDADPAAAPAAPPVPSAQVLLHLPPRELALYGIIENRGFVVIAAGLGLLWEFAGPRFFERVAGDQASRGMFRRAARMIFVDGGPALNVIVYGFALLVAFLLVSRVFSIVWAIIRLNGFTLTQVGEDLRAEYGLLTRVTATIPRRRIQSVTVRTTPLHRWLGRASLRVATAGGGALQNARERGGDHREWLAPIMRQDDVAALVATLLPGVDVTALAWRPVDARAFRRAVKPGVILSVLVAGVTALFQGWHAVWVLVLFAGWSIVHARRYVANLGWTTTDDVAAMREGAFVLATTIVPLRKIQSVTRHESPFDRRWSMARVRLDVAGSGASGSRVNVPYLPAGTADGLHAELSAAAARTAFQW